MFCPNCGAENPEDAVFCGNCGKNISKEFQAAKRAVQEDHGSATCHAAVSSQPYDVQPYRAYRPVPAAVRKPLKRSTKAAIVTVAVIAAAAIVLFNVGLAVTSPEAAAKNFFESIRSSDWKRAYSMLNVTENGFVNEKNFQRALKDANAAKVINYSVVGSAEKDALKDTPGSSDKKSGVSSQLSRTVTIQYTTATNSQPQTVQVDVVKQPEKRFLFFDSWKITPLELLVPDVTIDAPKDCSVFLDGTKLPDSYLDKDSQNTGNDAPSGMQYKIPNLFRGNYTLKTTSPYLEDSSSEVDVSPSQTFFTVKDLGLKKSVKEQLSETAQQAIKDLYTAAFAGKKFDSVKSKFAPDTDSQSNAESAYQDLVSRISKNGGEGFKDLTFTNLTCADPKMDSSESGNGSGLSVVLNIQADYSYTYADPSYFSDEPTSDYKGTDSRQMSLTYRLCDKKWLISGEDGLVIYY